MDSLKIDGSVSWEMGPHHSEITGRRYLQLYGTEAHREVFGDNFWIDQALPDPCAPYYGRKDPFDLLVFTDVRYQNEAERIRECGGEVWLIDRPSVEDLPDSHASENIDFHVDTRIINNGTLDDLHDAVDRELCYSVLA